MYYLFAGWLLDMSDKGPGPLIPTVHSMGASSHLLSLGDRSRKVGRFIKQRSRLASAWDYGAASRVHNYVPRYNAFVRRRAKRAGTRRREGTLGVDQDPPRHPPSWHQREQDGGSLECAHRWQMGNGAGVNTLSDLVVLNYIPRLREPARWHGGFLSS
ncbi:hypothetical protein L209DRAFT_189022 [Thermothelomyces heterothallicus CBS 203.75]